MSMKLVKDALKIAYFCKFHSKNKLQIIKTSLGEKRFKEALDFLEEFNVIEYPIVYPEYSADFPKGVPYPSVNYFLANFIYYPAWVQGYISHLQNLKKLIKKLKITEDLIENLRDEISEIDPDYRELLKDHLNTITSWSAQDQKVIEHLLDKKYRGKIKFSKSVIYWKE